MENERLNFEELQQKRVELGLADYLNGGGRTIACSAGTPCPDHGDQCPDGCLPCENWCHN